MTIALKTNKQPFCKVNLHKLIQNLIRIHMESIHSNNKQPKFQ